LRVGGGGGMPTWMKFLSLGAGLVFLASFSMLVMYPGMVGGAKWTPPPKTALSSDFDGEPLLVGSFNLVNQNGDDVNELLLYKHVTIAAFVFSNCPLACPTITTQMKMLQESLSDTQVRFTAFSIDPGNDSPSVLKAWGERLKVNWETWSFVTERHPLPAGGPAQTVRQIYSENLKAHLATDPKERIAVKSAADPSATMDNIVHPFELYLLGPKGEVLAKYAANRQEDIDALRVRAREADALLRGIRGGDAGKPSGK